MSKSPDAFRTIREVADWLGVAAHVLRFWESKFSQIKPVKRAGGRRYYRPADMELVGGIKVLLHDRGMTVRGVQRMLREDGVAAVSALSPSLDAMAIPSELVEGIAEEAAWHADAQAETELPPAPAPAPEIEMAQTPNVVEREPAAVAEEDTADATVESEHAATSEPEPALFDMSDQGDAPPEAAPAKDDAGIHQTPGLGLDRLAAFVAEAKQMPDDNRSRLRPAIAALRRLKDRMEKPVESAGG